MKINTKVFIFILFVAISNMIAFTLITSTSKTQLQKQIKKEFVESSTKLFKNMNTTESKLTHTLAFILATNPEILKGYAQNNRSIIIEQTKKIWNTLNKEDKLIYEIHYFKKPATSFVNFYNLKKYGQDISAAREDVVNTFKQIKPSNHFWICRTYPGLRTTYPIKLDNKIVGVISVGLHLNNYSKLFYQSLNTKNILIYKNSILKQRLSPANYKKFLKNKTKFDGWVFDTKYAQEYKSQIKSLDFKQKQQTKLINDVKTILLSLPLIDDQHIINGYLLLIKPIIVSQENRSLSTLMIYLLVIESLFFIVLSYIFIKKYVQRIYNLIDILNEISENNFTNVYNFKPVNNNNELSILEKNTINMAKKLSLTFNNFSSNISKFKFQAEHDPLTGLLNRKTLDEIDSNLLKSIEENNLSVIMLDIDYFKQINDTYGHTTGDIVLKKVAHKISSLLREDDLIFRYGGEEFFIILKNNTKEKAKTVAHKIIKSIENLKIYSQNGEQITVTISGGLAHYNTKQKTLSELIKSADKALYKAKDSGRNQIIICAETY